MNFHQMQVIIKWLLDDIHLQVLLHQMHQWQVKIDQGQVFLMQTTSLLPIIPPAAVIAQHK